MNNFILRGEIYIVDLGAPSKLRSSIQIGKRPMLIVSNDIGNKNSTTIIAAAITSKFTKPNLPTHISLSRKTGLYKPSIVLTEQLHTIDKDMLQKYIGKLRDFEIKKLNEALKISIGLKRIRKETEIRPLCHKCASEYEETGEYEVRYLKSNQNYEPCMKCDSPRGKNRLLIRYAKLDA